MIGKRRLRQSPWKGARNWGALALSVGLLAFALTSGQPASPSSDGQEAKRIFARATADDYQGDEYCASCHEQQVMDFAVSGHASFMSGSHLPIDRKGCEGCHGSGGVHQADDNPEVVSFTAMTPKESSAACMRCHGETLSESHWKKTAHSKADMSCVSCHQIHPKRPGEDKPHSLGTDARSIAFNQKTADKSMLKDSEARLCGSCHAPESGQFRLNSHHPVNEGSMVCSDCHATHPSRKAKTRNAAFKENCVSCHAEFKGPFVYEHDPVAGFSGDGCLDCHKAHGSHNPSLLNSYSRGLCAQCHTEKLTTHYPGSNCWNAGCHASPHGSNTDPLLRKP